MRHGDSSGRDRSHVPRRLGRPHADPPQVALREVGGTAVRFCPVADISSWTQATLFALNSVPDKQAMRYQAERFTWAGYARRMVDIYEGILAT